jgi:hypothetical protein
LFLVFGNSNIVVYLRLFGAKMWKLTGYVFQV